MTHGILLVKPHPPHPVYYMELWAKKIVVFKKTAVTLWINGRMWIVKKKWQLQTIMLAKQSPFPYAIDFPNRHQFGLSM